MTIAPTDLFTDAEAETLIFSAFTSNPDAVRPQFATQAIQGVLMAKLTP